MTIYSNPEKFGLAIVGEIEWSDGCYQFNLTVVWRNESGALFYADDSGCSCPSPYEDTGRDELIPITRPQDLIDHLDKRLAEAVWGTTDDEDAQRLRGLIGELVQKVRQVSP